MESRKVVYANVFEAVTRRFGDRLHPEAKRRLREAGFDPDGPPKAVYSVEVWRATLQILCDTVLGDLPPERARIEIGRSIVAGYCETFAGRMLVAFSRQVGPRATLASAGVFLRSGANFTTAHGTDAGERAMDVSIHQAGPHPEMYAGMLLEGLTRSGARGVRVERVEDPRRPGAVVFRCSWEA